MAEYNKTTQEDMAAEDISFRVPAVMLQDLLRSFMKLWWLVALLAVLFSGIALLYSVKNYVPVYKAEATFTVETYSPQSGYTFFYDNHTAAQMALTFPFLLDSDLLLDRVKIDMGNPLFTAVPVPRATAIPNSNLFTLSVTCTDPQLAYDYLCALIRNYPDVAQYVIGKTKLNPIDYPEFPTKPDNSTQHLRYAGLGLLSSLILSALIIVLHALTRNTVRKESDITNKLYTDWMGSVPLVLPKRSGGRRDFDLSIRNKKVGSSFKESFHGIGLQVVRKLEDRKVLLLTATGAGEGTTTVTRNLALELADQGKRVLVLDGNFYKDCPNGTDLEEYLLGRRPIGELADAFGEQITQLRCTRAMTEQEIVQSTDYVAQLIALAKEKVDYILIDAPICQRLDAVSVAAESAEAILYVIAQDSAKLPQIMNCFEDLNQFDAVILGCVLNRVRTGITGYGYGYGYGYGKGYYYGRYGGYGYGEERAEKGK